MGALPADQPSTAELIFSLQSSLHLNLYNDGELDSPFATYVKSRPQPDTSNTSTITHPDGATKLQPRSPRARLLYTTTRNFAWKHCPTCQIHQIHAKSLQTSYNPRRNSSQPHLSRANVSIQLRIPRPIHRRLDRLSHRDTRPLRSQRRQPRFHRSNRGPAQRPHLS
jgi:hypothetical protein